MIIPQVKRVEIFNRPDLNGNYFVSWGRGIALKSAKIGSKEAVFFNFLNSKIYCLRLGLACLNFFSLTFLYLHIEKYIYNAMQLSTLKHAPVFFHSFQSAIKKSSISYEILCWWELFLILFFRISSIL